MTTTGNALLVTIQILACGYLIHGIPLWRIFIADSSGYSLYFRILVLGLIWHVAINALFSPTALIWDWPAGASPASGIIPHAPLIAAIIFNLTIRGLTRLCAKRSNNFNIWLEKSVLKNARKYFDLRVLMAIEKNVAVMVTLDNGKVYIGYVLTHKEDAKWLTLMPMYSGYLGEETKKIKITNNYPGVRAVFGDKFDVTFPIEKIVSLQFFDPDVIRSFERDASSNLSA